MKRMGGRDGVEVGVDLNLEACDGGKLTAHWRDVRGGEAVGSHDHREADGQVLAVLAQAFFARREELSEEETKRLAPHYLGPVRRIEKDLGQRLGNLLLPAGPVRARFKELSDGGQHLVLRLRVSGVEPLASTARALPWELVRISEVATFGRGNVELVRLTALAPSIGSDMAPMGSVPRVLVIQGSQRCAEAGDAPKDVVSLKAHRILAERLDRESDLVVWSGTPQDLRLYLKSSSDLFDLMVFEGHGASDRLWMDDPVSDCGAIWVKALELVEIVRGRTRAAVLVACNAGQAASGPGALPGVAEALAEAGIPTLAFQTVVLDIETPDRDETHAALVAVAELVRRGGTLRMATARIRASLTKVRAGDEVAFARPVLWQPDPEDVWIGRPPSDGWDLTRRSPCAERPWGDGEWLTRPANNWGAVLSADGRAWAHRSPDGVRFTTVDETNVWTVKRIDSNAIPVAISPIDQDRRVSVLTRGERSKEWRVFLDANPHTSIPGSDVEGDVCHGAWVGDRFAWTDAGGSVNCPGDLPAADATHISSATDGELTITAWIDGQGVVWAYLQHLDAMEVRRLPLPDQAAEIDELAVALTPGGGNLWIRTGTGWRGCGWASMDPAGS